MIRHSNNHSILIVWSVDGVSLGRKAYYCDCLVGAGLALPQKHAFRPQDTLRRALCSKQRSDGEGRFRNLPLRHLGRRWFETRRTTPRQLKSMPLAPTGRAHTCAGYAHTFDGRFRDLIPSPERAVARGIPASLAGSPCTSFGRLCRQSRRPGDR